MSERLRVVTMNIHKGMSQFNRRLVIHELREGLRATSALFHEPDPAMGGGRGARAGLAAGDDAWRPSRPGGAARAA